VAPLLRLKDNNCHIDESERVLKDAQKFSELVILYEKKGLHNKGEVVRPVDCLLLVGRFLFEHLRHLGLLRDLVTGGVLCSSA